MVVGASVVVVVGASVVVVVDVTVVFPIPYHPSPTSTSPSALVVALVESAVAGEFVL